jgi:hypothetical protein
MAIDVTYGFDSADLQDQMWIQRIYEYKRQRANGVPYELLRRVLKTRAGRAFVLPLAQTMTPGQAYTANELGTLLGRGWTARRVGSKLTVLGRPESRFGVRIFERPSEGQYAITPAMKEAILGLAA